MKKLRLHQCESLYEELDAYGFEIENKLPWHWRITKPDYSQIVDIWPTVRKWWQLHSKGSACHYSDDETLIIHLKEVFVC